MNKIPENQQQPWKPVHVLMKKSNLGISDPLSRTFSPGDHGSDSYKGHWWGYLWCVYHVSHSNRLHHISAHCLTVLLLWIQTTPIGRNKGPTLWLCWNIGLRALNAPCEKLWMPSLLFWFLLQRSFFHCSGSYWTIHLSYFYPLFLVFDPWTNLTLHPYTSGWYHCEHPQTVVFISLSTCV